jgi:DNA-binding NtrC family response regulator
MEALGVCVQKVWTILIADRNPHVRSFLQREMGREGYRVRLAENARDLLQEAFDCDPIDLIILDPDLPDAVDFNLMSALRRRMPRVPVILHAHQAQVPPGAEGAAPFAVVEKGGSSVERLKEVAEDFLKCARPALAEPLSASPSEP